MNYGAANLARSGIGSDQLACGGFGGRAEKRSFLIEHNMNGEMREQLLEFFLFAKRPEKCAILELRQNLACDAARHKNATARKRLERQASGFGAAQRHEVIERLDTGGTRPLETRLGDFRRRVRS